MKRWILLFFMSVLSVLFMVCIYDHYYYDPLEKINTKCLFNIESNLKRINGEDLVGLSFHGEFLDIYKYEVENLDTVESIVASKDYLEDFFSVHNIKQFYNWTHCSDDSFFVSNICNPIQGTAPKCQLVIELVEKIKSGYFCCLYESDCRYYLFVLDPNTNIMFFLQCKI